MAILNYSAAFRDVNRYTSDILKQLDDGIVLFATYRKVWNDGFGARGWKLNATMSDPEIIASTRQTGQRVNTSVFVHDILDHLLSGFGVSGHRSEAMALRQLSYRTGSDPWPDYKQMVIEDILNGRVNGEDLARFLPHTMLAMLPVDEELTDKEVVAYLNNAMGVDALVAALVDHFFTLGKQGEAHAVKSWAKLGLNPDKATNMGLALQALLEKVDTEAERSSVDSIDASIVINNNECIFITKPSSPGYSESVYHKAVAA